MAGVAFGGSAAQAQETPAAVAAKLAEGSDSLSALWTTEGARLPVIIEFAMPPIADAPKTEDPDSIDAPRIQAVRGGQDAILGSLFGSEAEIARAEAAPDTNLKRMTYTPFFGMVATAQDVEKLSADPRVVRIHEDAIADASLAESRYLIGMDNAYIQGATGQDFRVAILDTGGRRSHEFLSRQIISAACYSSTTGAPYHTTSICPGGVSSSTDINSANDCDPFFAIGCSHGTHVAGIAAGYNTNQQSGEPASGVAREARIISINVNSRFLGPPLQLGSFGTDQLMGLERVYALRTTMNIAAVNMSLGSGQHFSACDTDPRKPIIDLLRAANIATVIAAGNNGFDTSVGAPGCISTAITVASSTKFDARSGFSNWGTLIDVVAPGSAINSSYVSGASNTTYESRDGTSMAAPQVTGAFAALRSVRPWATVDQIEAALKSTGIAITSAGTTKPRIRVDLALAALPTLPPPPNDNFAQRTIISGPTTVTGNNTSATAEAGEPIHAGRSNARNSVWWNYTPTTTGPVTIDTFGSAFDTVLAVYTGNAVNALTEVASNDDAGGGNRSSVTFQGTPHVSYRIAVAGFNNAAGPITINVVRPPPPNDNFANATLFQVPGTQNGTTVGATAETGEPNHAGVATARNSAWWSYTPARSGDIEINTGGSSFDTVLAVYTGGSVASLTEVASNDDVGGGGTRSRVVFRASSGTTYAIAIAGKANAEGSITEGTITVTVTLPPPPAPANDNFSSRITLPGPGTVAGTNVSATAETGEPNHAGNSTARKTVWWRYTPAAAGQVTLDTFGSDFNTVLAVYTGSTVGNLTPVASNFGGNTASQVTFQGAAGTSYAIAVAGHSNASGIIALTLQLSGGPAETTVVAAVTPVARATQVGSTVTAFATMINSGAAAAVSCSIAVPAGNPVTFEYRSRNHNTGALGPVNQPVNIAAGARQDYLMSFRPTGALQQELALIFDCVNTAPAGSVLGLNTFLLIGTTGAPPADLLSIAVTPSNDGIMNIPLGGTGFAVLAAQNIGASATLQARLSGASILSTPTSLAGTMVICRTNPTTGACLATPAATVNFTANAAEMVTFTAFVTSNGTEIPFNPGATRLFVHFFQGSTPVGSASVAARTVAPPPDGSPSFVAAR